MRKMIAYCGLDCEKCDAYLATVNDDNALREKTAQLWSELNQVDITAEQINCEGCPRWSQNSLLRQLMRDPKMCCEKRNGHLRQLSGNGYVPDGQYGYWQ